MIQIRILLTTIALLIATTAYAGIEPTSGRYIESNTDLSIKVIGGQLTWKRDYRDRQWRFNRSWESLVLTYDASTGNVESIRRANDIYKKLDSAGTVFKFGHRRTIRKQADGSWLWKDRDGNTTKYDTNGKTISMHIQAGSKITLMYNNDNKLSGAKDVHDVQVLWIEYDLVTGQVSKAKDYGNREVLYTWQAVNNTASPVRYKLMNVKDARGYDWQYAYAGAVARDGRVDINSRTDPEGRVAAVAYGGSGRASGVTNALGTTNYTFDYIKARKEFYLKTTDPAGRVSETWFERDGEVKRRDINGINIITITEDLRKDIETDTFGRVTTKDYDEFKNLLKITYPDGTSRSATYDVSNSNILTKSDERGIVTKFEYWPNGRLKKVTEALATSAERSSEYTYDQIGQMLTKTQVGDAVTATAVTQYFYDVYGNVSKIIDAELNEIQYTSYDSQGNSLVIIDGTGNNWFHSYDALGNRISSKNPRLEETINEYNKVGKLARVTYPDLNFIQIEYDNQDRVIKKIDELGFFNLIQYDSFGNKISETDKMGRVINYSYDLLNRQTETKFSIDNIIKFNYPSTTDTAYQGSLYSPIKIEYPTFNQLFKYNILNKLTEEKLEYTVNGQTITETKKINYYNNGSKIEYIDTNNNISEVIYDEFNRIKEYKSPLLEVTSYKYNNRNNLLEITNANNNIHSYNYDKINRKISETKSLGETESYTYNQNNKLIIKIDAMGQKIEMIYDSANYKDKIKIYNKDGDLDKTVNLTYNSRGSINSYDDGTTQGTYSYDNAQQKLTETINYGPENFSYTYTYHHDGQKASYKGIDNVTYNYHYNNLGFLNNIVVPNEGNISYQNFLWNKPQTIKYPGNIIRTNTYDGLQRINSINVKDDSSQTMMSFNYTYSPQGNIINKNTEHGSYTYGYDNLERLLSADYPNLTDETFTYDALGNKKTDSNTGISEWLYNQNNQLINSVDKQYVYDANGSLIQEKDATGQLEKQYIYNTENRLAEFQDGDGVIIAAYYYDPFGRRLSKTITNPDLSTTITYFHYNEEGYSAEKTNGQIISYLFSPNDTWSTNPILKRENNIYYYFQNDHQGTPNILHDKQGQVVNSREMKAFGDWSNSINIVKNNFAFAGQYKDVETNTYYNYFRYYNPNFGRYNSHDPNKINGGINSYQYSNLSPNSNLDYFGLKVTGKWTAGLEPGVRDFKVSCSSATDCVDFDYWSFDWLFAVNFHIEGSANVTFGVECEDDCPKDNWSYTNEDDPIYLEASLDSQFAPPAWCGLLGYALKKAGAKQIHVATAAFACWTALIFNVNDAIPERISQLKKILANDAIPYIASLYMWGPDKLCVFYRIYSK